VVLHRFDLTRAYQAGSAMSRRALNAMQRVTMAILPDLTIILDVPVGVGLKRAAARRGG
jgi:dTMP kinase